MWTRSRRSSTDRLALLLAAGLCLGTAAARAQEPSPETVREKARAVLGNSYQQKLPGDSGEAGGDGAGEDDAHPPPGLSSPPGDSGLRSRTRTAGVALTVLLYVTLAFLGVAALVLLLVWLIRELSSRRSRSGPRPGPVPEGTQDRPDPGRGPSPAALADAERLASQERWSEAVHLLLLVAIRHLTARFSVPQTASRTSREIARLLPLQREARDAFAGLVRTVEVSLFGGAPVGPDEYRASLEHARLLLESAS